MSRSYRLGDLTRTLRGRVPANTVDDPVGPRFFGIAEISARGRSAPRYIERGTEQLDDAAILEEGDVVISLLGNIGDATIIESGAAGAVLGRECAALRVTAQDVLRPAWLSAWTASDEFRSQVARDTSGTTMPRLSPRALENFTVTVPSLVRQLEVDGLVRRFDAAIATTATTLQQLEALRVAELQLAMAKGEESE
jgi:restriction endonuclease S subunit